MALQMGELFELLAADVTFEPSYGKVDIIDVAAEVLSGTGSDKLPVTVGARLYLCKQVDQDRVCENSKRI